MEIFSKIEMRNTFLTEAQIQYIKEHLETSDFYKKKKYKIGGYQEDYHIIDETIDQIINEHEESSLSFTKENINELSENGDINDVIKSFNIQKQLNSKIWVNGKINSRVRLKLLDIADKFFDDLQVDWVKPKDIIMTGSLANYDWSKYSDIDLHILIDFKEVDERVEFVKDYFDSKKTIWNEQHEGLKIYGFPIEIYVQDINEEHTASGEYSLEKNEWINEPERDELSAVKLNKKYIKVKTIEAIKKIETLERRCKEEKDVAKLDKLSETVKNLFDRIRGIRKESLKKNGEMSTGNIFFKCLRRMGYIGRLVDLKSLTYDKINSIK